jgi:hypothetical protein
MIFRLAGVYVERFRARFGRSRDYNLPRAKVFLFPMQRPGELLCNCTRVIGRGLSDAPQLLLQQRIVESAN